LTNPLKCDTIRVQQKRGAPARGTKMGDKGTPRKKRPRKVSEKSHSFDEVLAKYLLGKI
jgi:hypothetical protein